MCQVWLLPDTKDGQCAQLFHSFTVYVKGASPFDATCCLQIPENPMYHRNLFPLQLFLPHLCVLHCNPRPRRDQRHKQCCLFLPTCPLPLSSAKALLQCPRTGTTLRWSTFRFRPNQSRQLCSKIGQVVHCQVDGSALVRCIVQ